MRNIPDDIIRTNDGEFVRYSAESKSFSNFALLIAQGYLL
jgi:hypothetical protein